MNTICTKNEIKMVLEEKGRFKKTTKFIPKMKWPLYDEHCTLGHWSDISY